MARPLPLLLLPGMLCDAAFWRAKTSGLSDVCEPIVAAYGVADRFEIMAERVLETAPDRFALAGHSMGGRVAQEIYRRAPERVAKLALLGTDYRGHADPASRLAEEQRREAMLSAVAAHGLEAFAKGWTRQVLTAESLRDEALVDAVVAMMARHSPEVMAAQTLAGLLRPDYTHNLADVACPTLVCAGAEDQLRPVEIHRQMADRIPGARLVVVEGAAHMLAMERPEAVTQALRAWILGA